MYTRTQNPWLLAAGAGGGLASVYSEAMTRIAQIRAQQEQQAQQQQMAQQMFGYKQQQDSVDNQFRERQLKQQGDYQTGMLKNASERNDVMAENAMLRALFGSASGGSVAKNPNDVPTSTLNQVAGIQGHSIDKARAMLPRVGVGEMPVQINPASGMAQAPNLLQAMVQAGRTPDEAASAISSFWTQQPQPNVTTNMVPTWGGLGADKAVPQTNSWNSATVNTNAVLEAIARNPALAQAFGQAGLPTNSVPQGQTNAQLRIGRFNVIPR